MRWPAGCTGWPTVWTADPDQAGTEPQDPLRTTTSQRVLVVRGAQPLEVAERPSQIFVRWKFRCERDGVGPRWPW